MTKNTQLRHDAPMLLPSAGAASGVAGAAAVINRRVHGLRRSGSELSSWISAIAVACLWTAGLMAQVHPARANDQPVVVAQARSCKAVSTCREAVTMWCGGYRRADGDNDGIPCENVCSSLRQVEAIKQEIGC